LRPGESYDLVNVDRESVMQCPATGINDPGSILYSKKHQTRLTPWCFGQL